MNEIKKIVVGMSGGVDSAMTAYLLLQQGYAVSGATMLLHDPEDALSKAAGGCYGPANINAVAQARDLCTKLGIEHHTVQLADPFRRLVMAEFRQEYRRGRTPNPCVLCNPYIKFGALLESLKAAGVAFDRFATGHYARIEQNPENGRYLLKKGLDAGKDQSYFLYRLNQQQLSKVIFPLGAMHKKDVKVIAAQAGFTDLAQKSESQDFADRSVTGFFETGAGMAGELVDESGHVLGRHAGIERFTIGQRRGLNIGGSSQPLYVLAIDPQTRQVVVGPKNKLAAVGLTAMVCNWIAFEALDSGITASAKVRSSQRETLCRLAPAEDGMVVVSFETPVYTAAPGQSVVFYLGDMVLGGGFIQSIRRASGGNGGAA
jgi:tRNA-specific 2-thiouridylase